VSRTPPVTMVCADLFGTMVADEGMVERAFSEAIGTQGIVPGTGAYARCMVQVHQARGEPDIDIFRKMFPGNEAGAQVTNLTFQRSFAAAIDRIGLSAMPGAEAAIDKLTGAGVRVCLITGIGRGLLGRMLDTLGWWDRVDLAICPDDVARGCPWPDPVLTAVLRLGIADVRQVAVAGGTESAILSGCRSGAGIVAGVPGTHSAAKLRRAGATHLIGSIADLPDLISPDAPPGQDRGLAGQEPEPAGHEPEPAGRESRAPHAHQAGRDPAPAPPQVPLEGRRSGL
jgi:phosphonatase-like hydrolase